MGLKIIRGAPAVGGALTIVMGLGLAVPAQALITTGPSAYVVEGNGIYTLVNNTSLQVYRFIVSNPAAAHGAAASTSQKGWTAFVCTDSRCAADIASGFLYYDSGLVFDLAAGTSTSSFSFTALPASTYDIYLHDASGNNTVVLSGTAVAGVPEPATWALMIVGLGAAGTLLRRRRVGGNTVTA